MNKHPWDGEDWVFFAGIVVFLCFAVALVSGW